MLYKLDALKFFKKQKNCSIDLIFTDPPYALGCGSGSEIIGAMKAGFEKIEGCEINPKYIEIARARIKYWKKKIIDENALFINQKQNESSNT